MSESKEIHGRTPDIRSDYGKSVVCMFGHVLVKGKWTVDFELRVGKLIGYDEDADNQYCVSVDLGGHTEPVWFSSAAIIFEPEEE